jgi:hypothetical protein
LPGSRRRVTSSTGPHAPRSEDRLGPARPRCGGLRHSCDPPGFPVGPGVYTPAVAVTAPSVTASPYGSIRPGEDPADAAAREAEEETGWRPNRPLRRLIYTSRHRV